MLSHDFRFNCRKTPSGGPRGSCHLSARHSLCDRSCDLRHNFVGSFFVSKPDFARTHYLESYSRDLSDLQYLAPLQSQHFRKSYDERNCVKRYTICCVTYYDVSFLFDSSNVSTGNFQVLVFFTYQETYIFIRIGIH